jgi:hypothetical protein
MIEKRLILAGSDAELLSNALAEVKTKIFEESEARVDAIQALDALVSFFRNTDDGSFRFQPRRNRHRSRTLELPHPL